MNTALLVVIIVASILVLGLIAYLVYFIQKKKKIQESEEAASQVVDESTSDLAKLFGSKKNIKAITSTGSRVSVELNDITLVDIDKIKEIYKDVLFTNNKVVFVIGEKSKEFAAQLEKKING